MFVRNVKHRGILVLDVNRFLCGEDPGPDTAAGVEVTCICTRLEQIDRLRRDLISGRLADDLSDALGRHGDYRSTTANGLPRADGGDSTEAEVVFEVMIDVGELDASQADLA